MRDPFSAREVVYFFEGERRVSEGSARVRGDGSRLEEGG